MTRQAFLAQMPVPPPSTALCLSRLVPPGNLSFFSLSPFVAFAPASLPFSLPSLWSSLSTLSPEVSRDRVGWSLYSYRLLRSHIAERRAHVLPCSGPSRRRANREQTFMPLYTAARSRTGKPRARGRPSGNIASEHCVLREPEKERGSETGPCLALPSICFVR